MTAISCPCGTFKATVDNLPEESAGRIVCYCKDCRKFMRHIDRAEELDPHGGVEFISVYPSNITFSSGQDQLSCMRLTEKGLNRWVVRCCGAAVGTSTPKLPFLGLLHGMFKPASKEALGPVRHRLFGREAEAKPPAGTPDKAHLSTMIQIGVFILKGFLKGRGKNNPFFKADQRTPLTDVTIIVNPAKY